MLQHTNTKIEVKNYPYGRLTTSMFFSVEFNAKKGFRSVRQTINPKTGLLNKPKKSTYSAIMLLDSTEGFCSFKVGEFYHIEKFNDLMMYLYNNFALFTPEQVKYLYSRALSFMKLETYALVQYCNSDMKTVLAILDPTVKKIVEGVKLGGNIFNQIRVDHEALEKTKEEGYQPFKLVETHVIELN